MALFFLIHYTFFVVISTLFLKEVYPTFMQGFGQGQWYLFSGQSILKMLLEIPVSYLGVFLGYAVSFIKEVRTMPRQRSDEYFRYTSLAYARIFVMQLTCMFGARIANFFGVPVFVLFCMIAIKILVDFLFLQKGNSAVDA